MTGSLTDYTENKVLDHIMGVTPFSAVSPVFVCLMTTPVAETDTGSSIAEPVTAGGYWRVSTGSAIWNSAVTGYGDNAATIAFPTATTPWGVVSHMGLADASTPGTGNLLAYATLDSSKNVLSGDPLTFAIGDLYLELD